LEKDEFNIFHTKSKKNLAKKLIVTNSKIQKLLDLKLRGSECLKAQQSNKNSLIAQNLKLRKSLIEKLDLEID
jgi:hypothetical protein